MNKILENAIHDSLTATISDWNRTKLRELLGLYGQTYPEFVQGKKTQEITKIISPILTQVFYLEMNSRVPGFIKNEIDGRNFEYYGVPYELNMTLATSNSWTGNGYKKVPNHILLRFSIDENGLIYQKFAMLIDLGQCKSSWTLPSKSNFSTLKILNEDFDKTSLINGDFKSHPKYLGLIMEEI